MDSTKASDTRKLCCDTFCIRQLLMETRSRGEPVPHVTGPQQCHTARLQNHRSALRKLEVEGSKSLPGSALTGPLGRSYARPLHAGQSACYRHLGSLPTWRGGQRKANGAALSWVKQGAPQAELCTWGAVQGHGGPCTLHSRPACLRPVLRRVQFTKVLNPFHFSTLDFCFLLNFSPRAQK